MQTWYRAVCDECKEMIHVLVHSTFHVSAPTNMLLKDQDKQMADFLDRHTGCELRLVWRDDQYEKHSSGHLADDYHECGLWSCFCPKCRQARNDSGH